MLSNQVPLSSTSTAGHTTQRSRTTPTSHLSAGNTLSTANPRPNQSTASHPGEPGSTTTISVLLVDDHALIREGLRQLLEMEGDLKIVGDAGDGFEALRKIRELQPAVVLMDISLPMIDGLALTRQVTYDFPDCAVIMLTMHRQNQQVLQAMKNGARGYLLKSASVREVAQAIRVVQAGDVFVEPTMTGTIVTELRRLANTPLADRQPAINSLTEKEIEIIRYVASGMSNKEIAEQLSYSEKTVKNYLSIIFQKLGIRDRTQAAIFGLRQGLIPDEPG